MKKLLEYKQANKCYKKQFFLYLHKKHLKFGLNLEKQGQIVKLQKKKKTYIHIQRNDEITIYFSHCIQLVLFKQGPAVFCLNGVRCSLLF